MPFWGVPWSTLSRSMFHDWYVLAVSHLCLVWTPNLQTTKQFNGIFSGQPFAISQFLYPWYMWQFHLCVFLRCFFSQTNGIVDAIIVVCCSLMQWLSHPHWILFPILNVFKRQLKWLWFNRQMCLVSWSSQAYWKIHCYVNCTFIPISIPSWLLYYLVTSQHTNL